MVKLEPLVIRRLSCDSRCLFPVDIGFIKSRDPPLYYYISYIRDHILTTEIRPTAASLDQTDLCASLAVLQQRLYTVFGDVL